ncbi:MAG: hypothetical protein LBH91_08320 [Prevotellaceae bacterium]|jgi:flagellar capping protein FliD|nr:hypothetical protein [Prevotellaceae bacterium]
MDTVVLQRQLNTLNVNRQAKEAILTVIDLKINSEMKEVITRIDQMEKRVDQRFEFVDQRFEAMEQRMDQRFEAMEQRMDQRFEAVDQRFEAVDQRFEAMYQRTEIMDKHFYTQLSTLKWMIGIFATTMSAIMTAMLLKG